MMHPMARRDPQTLDQLLPRVLARLAEQSGKGRTLGPVWRATVGDAIARHSRPASLEGGTLVVSVASAEWAHTLSRQEDSLREQLNHRLGPGAVSSLVFQLE
jgi:predicted nucleic acid-binding Zn ribbon protein